MYNKQWFFIMGASFLELFAKVAREIVTCLWVFCAVRSGFSNLLGVMLGCHVSLVFFVAFWFILNNKLIVASCFIFLLIALYIFFIWCLLPLLARLISLPFFQASLRAEPRQSPGWKRLFFL